MSVISLQNRPSKMTDIFPEKMKKPELGLRLFCYIGKNLQRDS